MTSLKTTRRLRLPLAVAFLQLLLLAAAADGGGAVDDADQTSAAAACPMNATERAPADARLDADGALLRSEQSGRAYRPSEYRRVQGGGYALCACGAGAAKPCLQKCCKRDKVYVLRANGSTGCAPRSSVTAGDFEIPKLVNASGTFGSYEEDRFRLVYRKPKCSNDKKFHLRPAKNKGQDDFRVSETGRLSIGSGPSTHEYPPEQFCLEQFSDSDYQVEAIFCENGPPPGFAEEYGVKNVLYTVAVLLSLPFLIITFLVYALIRELRNLHGRSLMCHVATLLVAYTSLVVNRTATSRLDSNGCIVLAFTMQFSFLASFFWLNTMCFDLWWTFSRFRPPRGNLHDYESKKFLYYSIYAWGCTSLISLLTYCKQSWPTFLSSVVRPGFGVEFCWFLSKSGKLLYFYGPIGILLFANLLMFIYTAIMIIKHMRDGKVLNRRDSRRNMNNDKQRFVLYLKLFIVMGVNWLAEIVSWLVDSDGTSASLWYVTDIGNALQGVFIFLIFVCKKRVLVLLGNKLNLNCYPFNTFNSESTRTTNSNFSRTSTKTKNVVEMNSVDAQNSTSNQLHDVEV